LRPRCSTARTYFNGGISPEADRSVKRGSPGYPQNDVAIEDARAEREIAPLSSHRLEKFERLDNAALPAPRPRARGDPRKPIRRNLIDPPAALTRCHRYATYCSKQGEVPRSMHRRTRRSIGAARGEAAPLVRRFSSGVAYRANSLSLSLSLFRSRSSAHTLRRFAHS